MPSNLRQLEPEHTHDLFNPGAIEYSYSSTHLEHTDEYGRRFHLQPELAYSKLEGPGEQQPGYLSSSCSEFAHVPFSLDSIAVKRKYPLEEQRHNSFEDMSTSSTATVPTVPESTVSTSPASVTPTLSCPPPNYPDMTTMVNYNSHLAAPMVQAHFVDHKVCTVCHKRVTRDMMRHMRTHEVEKRFSCVFPKHRCTHKLGQFNRRYDFKKHLLNKHFRFDDPSVKRLHNLRDKLGYWGTCPCGRRFLSSHWLDFHISSLDPSLRCPETLG